ncbi:MAG TPA: class I SAM-dependent methyltransferase [Steroidobacteraceae bacterium]|jgi:2-polyprenyl-3-methyl-5-hydroxy-6-metoxy-1,4-benzoquinol methylase|nr:class I SAM-dependent methyltransferase [Steroidobacteraceae bacterium]
MSKASDYAFSNRSEVASFLPRQYQTVLEIGCSKGGFKASLNPTVEIWGVEPNESAAGQASTRGYKVLTGLYEEVSDKCPDNYFDVIICNDVIEHMADPDKFLEDIKRKMKKNGHLVGSIPNVRHFGNLFRLLIKKDWKYEDQGVLDRTHLRFFTEKSLCRTFSESGYVINEIKGINSDFEKPKTTRQLLRNTLLLVIILMTFGYFRDIKNPQFAFRIELDE